MTGLVLLLDPLLVNKLTFSLLPQLWRLNMFQTSIHWRFSAVDEYLVMSVWLWNFKMVCSVGLKSKIFGQKSTYSKKTTVFCEYSCNNKTTTLIQISLSCTKLLYVNDNHFQNDWEDHSHFNLIDSFKKIEWLPLSMLIFGQKSCI